VEELKFKILQADQCAFIRGQGDERVFITIHVDDLGIGGMTKNVDAVIDELKCHYKLKIQRGDSISYLGMNITLHPDGARTVDQGGYRNEIAIEYAQEISDCARKPQTPSSSWILQPPPKNDKKMWGKDTHQLL